VVGDKMFHAMLNEIDRLRVLVDEGE
jgi:hypothetical protein